MLLKFLISTLLITVAFAHRSDVLNIHNAEEISKSEKEGRILGIPITLVLILKMAGLIISPLLSLLEYKLSALSFASSSIAWLLQNYFQVIIGTAVVVGLCLITSSFASEPMYEVDYHLVQPARIS